ncbi:MAG: heme ABC exporter ATP-binding protein CcmA [Actinobacteria bacterium]|nr:heme ABC exporter ATP-binding protein CcmA [Actinomycetota bacterium]
MGDEWRNATSVTHSAWLLRLVISIRRLTVTYGRTLALDRLDLDLGPGVIGLFGPNGSGKSTLLRVLSGLLRPSAGTVELCGRPISSSDEGFRRRVGYAGHESGLYPRLTLEENLSLFARLYDLPARRGLEVAEEVGLSNRLQTRAGELSAGLKRRAAVARALLHGPDLLLLDEPYANLDDDAAEEVTRAIQGWSGPERTALIATHGAKRLKAYAAGGVILKQGRVVVEGRYSRAREPAPRA